MKNGLSDSISYAILKPLDTERKIMSTTLELVVQELQNRIGQITSQYETQLAVLKAQATEALQAKDAEIQELKALQTEPAKGNKN